jgi:hypothetical protein
MSLDDKENITVENERRRRMGGFDISYSDMRLFTLATAKIFKQAYESSREFHNIVNKECSIEEQKKLMAIADNVMR